MHTNRIIHIYEKKKVHKVNFKITQFDNYF